MNDVELELGLFIPWGCIYPVAQYSATPEGRTWMTDFHPRTAEYWSIKFYVEHLKRTYQRHFVLNEYINRTTGYKPFDIILEVMRGKFGNVFGRSSLIKYPAIPATKLSLGRDRKPDILGFGVKGNTIHVEFTEVTTPGRVQAGLQQLREKVDLMRQLKTEIEQRLRQANETKGMSLYPMEVDIHPATWKPNHNQLRIPILRVGESLSQQLAKIQWLCLKPTFRENAGKGHDGVILYEIHEVNVRQPAPREIVQALRRHILRAQAQHQQLLPIDAEAFWRQNQIAARDIAIIAGTAAAVAAIIIFVVIMPEIGIPFLAGAGFVGTEGVLGAGLAEGAVGAGLAEGAVGAGTGAGAVGASELVVMTRIADSANKVRIAAGIGEIAAEVEEISSVTHTMLRALPLPKP